MTPAVTTMTLQGVSAGSSLAVNDRKSVTPAQTSKAETMTRPLRHLPNRFDAAALVDVLKDIGLPLPDGAKLHASEGRRVSSAGVLFAAAKVDEALDKTELSNVDKIAVKIAIGNAGLMGR